MSAALPARLLSALRLAPEHADVFGFVEAHHSHGFLRGHVRLLVRHGWAKALEMLLRCTEALPPADVVRQLEPAAGVGSTKCGTKDGNMTQVPGTGSTSRSQPENFPSALLQRCQRLAAPRLENLFAVAIRSPLTTLTAFTDESQPGARPS